MGRIPKVDKERALEEHRSKNGGADPDPVFRPPRGRAQSSSTHGNHSYHDDSLSDDSPYSGNHGGHHSNHGSHGNQGYDVREMGGAHPPSFDDSDLGDYTDDPFTRDQRPLPYQPPPTHPLDGGLGPKLEAVSRGEMSHVSGQGSGYGLSDRPRERETSRTTGASVTTMDKPPSTNQRPTPSPPRPFSRGNGPFSPDVISELINKVIESGHGKELQATIMSKFYERFGVSPPPHTHISPRMAGTKRSAVGLPDNALDVPIKQECLSPPPPTDTYTSHTKAPNTLSAASGFAGIDPAHYTSANHNSHTGSHGMAAANQNTHSMSHGMAAANQSMSRTIGNFTQGSMASHAASGGVEGIGIHGHGQNTSNHGNQPGRGGDGPLYSGSNLSHHDNQSSSHQSHTGSRYTHLHILLKYFSELIANRDLLIVYFEKIVLSFDNSNITTVFNFKHLDC